MDDLLLDVRHAARMLRRQPVFSAIAILTLALGIGASTTIFTVVEAILLRSLPYRDADRLASIWVDFGKAGQSLPSISPLDFRDLRQMSQRFEAFAAGTGTTANLSGDGDPEQVSFARVTHDLFPMLGIEPTLGRGFLAEEEVLNGPAVVVLSHRLWQRRYGGDGGIIDRTIQVDGSPMQVVGVLPADFHLLLPPETPWLEDSELWAPLQDPYTGIRNRTTLTALGRLKPGVSFGAAQEELDSIASRLRTEHEVHALSDTRLRAVPLQRDLVKGVRPSLLLLSGAVLLVLLVACSNVAQLLVTRGAERQRELDLRASLGAGRWRILRQILTENALIAVVGGTLALASASWGLTLLHVLEPRHLPRIDDVRVGGATIAFVVACSAATVLLFGLAPALRASRLGTSRAGAVAASSGGRLRRRPLIIAEVAVSTVLLIAGGLLVRSFSSLLEVQPGFDASGVLTFRVSLPRDRYPDTHARTALYDRLEEQLRALPGVRAVGGISQLPFSPGNNQVPYAFDDATVQKWESVTADSRTVTEGYFDAVGTRLLFGRSFDQRDRPDGQLVVIVDETLARKAFPGEDAVGRRLQLPVFGPNGITRQWLEIVGVVEHTRLHDLARDVREQIYFPSRQRARSSLAVAMRTDSDPSALAPLVARVVRDLDANLPLQDVRPLADSLVGARSPARFTLILVAAFALSALLLALVGLYGALHNAVTHKRHELGVRRALGAARRDILRLILGYGMSLAAVGTLAGIALSLLTSRILSGMIYGVGARDPVTFAGAPLILLAVALLACLVPARRAVRTDPMEVLRDS